MKEDITKDIQERIIADLKRIYSPKVISHWQHPKNWGILNNGNGYAKITGRCGDTMEISIIVKDKKIVKCTFDTDGCGPSIACGSILTEMVTGMIIDKAQRITQDDVLEYCKGLPDADKHCALLAVNTFQKALDAFLFS